MLRVAISIFCRERAGFETSFLVLDEVFGNQDTEHRQQLVDFLNEIKVHYHQILIVNHIEDVTACSTISSTLFPPEAIRAEHSCGESSPRSPEYSRTANIGMLGC